MHLGSFPLFSNSQETRLVASRGNKRTTRQPGSDACDVLIIQAVQQGGLLLGSPEALQRRMAHHERLRAASQALDGELQGIVHAVKLGVRSIKDEAGSTEHATMRRALFVKRFACLQEVRALRNALAHSVCIPRAAVCCMS